MRERRRQIIAALLTVLLLILTVPIIGTKSDLALAGFSETKLVGVKHDEGLDVDEDGKFDYLVVGVEIDVLDAGFYEVDISRLLDSNSKYIDVYGSNYSFLDVGLHVLNVSLSGKGIYVSGLNPRNVSSIELYGGEYEWERYHIGSLWNVPLSKEYPYTDFDPPTAMLTGKIHDDGVDTDGDGDFNYLKVDVEINVIESGDYSVDVYGLRDIKGYGIDVWGYESGYFDVGLGWLNVSLSGYRIRAFRINASFVNNIYLYADYTSHLKDVPLARQYNYTEFDVPAILKGVIDGGVDTDDDNLFDYLEVGVQVDVSDPGNYEVAVSGLLDESFNYIDVYASTSKYLETGLHVVNLTLDGWRIYLSDRDPMYINHVSLVFWEKEEWREDYWDQLSQVSLSQKYLYTDFDPPGAVLTGNISDQGKDTDYDLKFEYLEVGVEVDVTEAGTYVLYVSGLIGAEGEWSYISVWDSKTTYLNVGVQTVNLYLYGPRIYVSNLNPVNVSYIGITDEQYTYHDSIYDVPLTGEYLYTDFEAPFMDVETKFVVYPDGRVAVEGALKYTNMYPEYTGPPMQGSFNLTSNQASAGLTVNLPDEFPYNQFPYNSTTAELLAQYSNGILHLGVNSTMILPSIAESIYPYNATDGTLTANYSGEILNIEVDGNTTLPELASQQFPFNGTDITVVGTYSPHTLDGTITFSVIDEFTFDDVNVDFKGNQTDFALNGTVLIVFGVPFDDFIIHNETELIQLIDQLKSDLVGEDGIVWNMTGGLLNVTNLDISYELNGIGADVTFKIDVHGDFVRALAYLMSGGRNEMLLSPVLNKAYQSVQSGSFDIQYNCTTSEASIKLTFSYDLKSLIDYVLTLPPGTTPYIVTHYGMSPTISLGDVVFVEAVSNADDVIADPDTGDIIAFRHPDYPRYIIIHRAVNKTQVDNTWYFQTQVDANSSPDYWTGNNTYDGMISENCLIGNVSSRIPLLGYVLSYPYSLYYSGDYIPYLQSTVAPRMSLLKAALSSVENMSIQLSYSSVDRRFDLQLTLVDKLEALADEIALILPEMSPPETPPEVRTFVAFVESLLNTTYASVGSADISFTYENGQADFEATATIEGDINAEVNYVKDLFFQFFVYQLRYDNVTVPWPWQLVFINQTKIDISNFEISAKLYETSFEGRIEGLTLQPPVDAINASHFKLERFFNLTAPQYPEQQEFPIQNQRLKITIEGGSNATHGVAIFRDPHTVPEPDATAPHTIIWYNQTLSSLKDLVFSIQDQPYDLGWIVGRVVEAESLSPMTGASITVGSFTATTDANGYYVIAGVPPGDSTVTASAVGYDSDSKPVHLDSGVTATVDFTLISNVPTGTLTITTTPVEVEGEVFINGTSWGMSPQSRVIPVGKYNVSFGDVSGYYTPSWQLVTVSEDVETTVTGVYKPVTHILTVDSSPISGVNFTVNGMIRTTNWSDILLEGTHTIIMPMTWTTLEGDVYQFDHWADASTDPTRVIDLTADTTVTAYYEYVTEAYTLTVNSDPVSGVEFTVDGITQFTPWIGDLAKGSHKIVMPSTWTAGDDEYVFDHWEDECLNSTRTISLTSNMSVTAYYVPAPPKPKYWTLTVNSDPITGVEFTLDGNVSKTTPYSASLIEGSHIITMPPSWTDGVDFYNFSHWEDESTEPTRTITLTENTTITATYELYVPPSGWIDGYVTDASTGVALAGATIVADGVSATTDATGYYNIETAPGTYTVTASMTDYEDDFATGVAVTARETTTVNFALASIPPTGTLSVNTTPVSGEVFVNDTSWGTASQSRVVHVGTYNVSFGDVAGYYTPAWQLVTVSEDVETTVTGVYEPILGAIDGTVTDASTGLPIAGATVTADGYSATTDSNGYYIITDVLVGTFTFTAEATGYYSNTKTSIVVESGVTTTVNFTLSLIVGWIDGYVKDAEASAALVGATITANGVSTTTNAVGYYKVELVPAAYTATASATGYVEKSKTATVTAGKTTTVNFALAKHGVVAKEITNPELVNATNPFEVDAKEKAATSLVISQISKPITIVVKNVTESADVGTPTGTWKVLGNYVQITVNDTDFTVSAEIRIYYTQEQLEASGLDENTLQIRFWNATSGEWEPVESHINTDEYYVWAIVDHFSFWALMGQTPTAVWPQPEFLAMVGIVVAVIAIVTVIMITRKRKRPHPAPKSSQLQPQP